MSVRNTLIRVAFENPDLRDTILPYVKQARNLPPSVERYVKEHKEKGMDEGKAWAVAWSRYCQYRNPDSPHCKQDNYFPGRLNNAKTAALTDPESGLPVGTEGSDARSELPGQEKEAALRAKVARLAQENPKLRPHLLPLLKDSR